MSEILLAGGRLHASSFVVRHFRILVVLALAVLVTPALLFAHAHLVKSTPAANAKLTVSPTALTLWFSERPEVRFTKIELADSASASVAVGAVATVADDAMAMTVPIPAALPNGKYTVSWRTAAADGHPSSGKFSFSVDAPAPAVPVAPIVTDTGHKLQPQPNSIVEPGERSPFSTSERWVELVALLAVVGAVVFRLFVMKDASLPADRAAEANDRARRLAQPVLVLFALATLWRLSSQANLIPTAMSSHGAAMVSVVRDTQWGHGWFVGALGVIVAAIGLLLARSSASGWVVAGIGAVTICFGEALTGHAGAMRHAPFAIATDIVHVLGAGGWLGGLTALLLCGMPATRSTDDRERATLGQKLVRAYHRAATQCVALVLISAVISAWLRLGSFGALTGSDYGRILLIKIGLAVVLLGFGWYHWRTVVTPEWNDDTGFRFKRSAAFELVVGAVLLGVTAMLISTGLPGA